MKDKYEPFCGFPYGFHEMREGIESDEEICVHCGKTKGEIEFTEPERIVCDCPLWDQEPHLDVPYRDICVRCGRPIK